jgi:uncharacterized protein
MGPIEYEIAGPAGQPLTKWKPFRLGRKPGTEFADTLNSVPRVVGGAFDRATRRACRQPRTPRRPGSDYHRAMSDAVETTHRHTNRLANETSPYLLQHAHNPVDWYPWGPDALARAKLLDRPIFLSIGYAACHWCHVMERESFEDEATAAFLNGNFIAIKVDREERPDLDQVYMAAVQAMTGGGGWPMSVFLTPQGRPFYGGTYFPNEPRHGLPSFRQLLEGIARSWRDQRSEVEQSGARLVGALVEQAAVGPRRSGDADDGRLLPAAVFLDAAVQAIDRGFDEANGGWGAAPKFPQSMTIEFLLRRAVAGHDPRPLQIARRSLDRMADGGIHDQLGGGFHRYSTDAIWLVPHFEQMLYDNAQLARLYVHASALTGDARYRDVAIGTLDYMARELATDEGAFAASQDADTDGVEGATFTWSRQELRDALGDGSPLFEAAYGVTAEGNWEGRTILSRVRATEELAASFGLDPAAVDLRLAGARQKLLDRRALRPQPARDDKALAAWNGLAIGAFADAARLLAYDPDPAVVARATSFRIAAIRAANTIVGGLLNAEGRLGRSWKDGRATGAGVLEDYAHLADGLLALYEATFDERWFTTARSLADTILSRFVAPDGGFYDAADDHERLVTRPRDPQDNAIPSGGAMAATVLLRLAAWTGDGRYQAAAERAIGTVSGYASRYPTGFAQWLNATDFALASVDEIAIVGDPREAATRDLLAPVASGYRPNQVLAAAAAADAARSSVPLLHDRPAVGGRATAYVCRNFACRRPVTAPRDLEEILRESRGVAP